VISAATLLNATDQRLTPQFRCRLNDEVAPFLDRSSSDLSADQETAIWIQRISTSLCFPLFLPRLVSAVIHQTVLLSQTLPPEIPLLAGICFLVTSSPRRSSLTFGESHFFGDRCTPRLRLSIFPPSFLTASSGSEARMQDPPPLPPPHPCPSPDFVPIGKS